MGSLMISDNGESTLQSHMNIVSTKPLMIENRITQICCRSQIVMRSDSMFLVRKTLKTQCKLGPAGLTVKI